MSQTITDLYLLFLSSDTFKIYFRTIYGRCKNTEIAMINSTNIDFVVSDEIIAFIERYYIKD